jgi:hypothetical protein
MSLVGIRCTVNGIKHEVIRDDGRTVLIRPIPAGPRGIFHSFPYKRWVPRGVVLPPVKPAPYHWLGAEAEVVGALKEMG